ncbi:MAG: hypothetical protein ABIO63_08960 [Casimicrobiaceae bacterium]
MNKVLLKKIIRLIIAQMFDGVYFVNVSENHVWVALTYRDVSVSEVESHMTEETLKYSSLWQMSRSIKIGSGFSYVHIEVNERQTNPNGDG